MAKRFLKHSTRSESDDVGCLSSFIGIFDFRIDQYSHKLLPDKKRGSGRHLGTGSSRRKLDIPSNSEIKLEGIDNEESRSQRVSSGMASVKTLMEEEMSRTYDPKAQKNELEQLKCELGIGTNSKRKNKKKSKNNNAVQNQHVNDLRGASDLDLRQYNSTIPNERSSVSFDLDALMVAFYCDNYNYEGQDDSNIVDSPLLEFTSRKELGDLAKILFSQKLVDQKQLTFNGTVQSREFIDALDRLSSNKELFLMLVQEPNSRLLKHIQDIHDAQRGNETSETLQDSVSKRDNSKEIDSSRDINKIVVLKPSYARIQNDSVVQTVSSSPQMNKSYFSFKGIKRRLRHVIGESRKEKHPISMDGILDRIPYGSKDAGDSRRSFVLAEHTSQPSAIAKKREKKPELKIADSQHGEYLERLVSLPEYNLLSPKYSPESSKELVLSPRKIVFSPSRQFNQGIRMDHLSPLRESMDEDYETQVTDLNQEGFVEDLDPKGSVEIAQTSDIKPSKEHDGLDLLSESIGNKPSVTCEGYKEEGSEPLKLGKSDDKLQLEISSLPTSSSLLRIESVEKSERLSPVSVLEPFLEDIASPESTTDEHVKLPIQSPQIEFREHVSSANVQTSSDFECKSVLSSSEFEGNTILHLDGKDAVYGFIRTILGASGMSCYGDLERWSSSNHVFDPSLFEEDISNIPLHNDPKLLFDCVNEVLTEIQLRLSDRKPSVSILRGGNIIEEVCKCTDMHIHLSEFTLDKITRKDMEGRTWVDHHFEIKAIVIEMGDAILEEIIEETMFML